MREKLKQIAGATNKPIRHYDGESDRCKFVLGEESLNFTRFKPIMMVIAVQEMNLIIGPHCHGVEQMRRGMNLEYRCKRYDHAAKRRTLRRTEELAALSDSTLMADSVLFSAKINSIRILNNSLGNNTVFETNARWINENYLLALEQGVEFFNEETIEAIETLALTCPYSGGNSVYRARSILGMINPGKHYDDLEICNSQGMYKNGVSKLQEQLNSLSEAEQRKYLEEVGVVVYPNPASTTININYLLNEHETATLSIYDLLGNKHKDIALYNDVNTRSISLQGLAAGLYVYQFISSANRVSTGKLIVE